MEPKNLKQKILETAVRLFIKDGIENVKTRQLTEFLGISRSHIYHYFSDWQSLCIEACSMRLECEIEKFLANSVNLHPTAKMRDFVEFYLPGPDDESWYLYRAISYLGIHNEVYYELSCKIAARWQALAYSLIKINTSAPSDKPEQLNRTSRQLMAMLNGYADRLLSNKDDSLIEIVRADIDAFFVSHGIQFDLYSS